MIKDTYFGGKTEKENGLVAISWGKGVCYREGMFGVLAAFLSWVVVMYRYGVSCSFVFMDSSRIVLFQNKNNFKTHFIEIGKGTVLKGKVQIIFGHAELMVPLVLYK